MIGDAGAMDANPTPAPARGRGFDALSATLATATAVLVAGTAWLRFGPPAAPATPTVGASAPALRLLDPARSEPLVLLGLRGKIVWVTFWSADPDEKASTAILAELEKVWTRFKPHSKFAMAALAVEADRPATVRAAVAATGATLPVYLASPETRRAFGVDRDHLPLHVLIDPTGHVAALSEGRDAATFARLAGRTQRWLDEIDPLGKSRFAAARPRRGFPWKRPHE